jgi:2,3-dihydroxy-p-cumate/2,3-dihydroxybenzoate 3,4-dioxygenase
MLENVRYKKLGYVELNVSDLARSRDFYEGMVGLQFVGEGPRKELRFRCSDDPYSIVLHKGDAPGHKRTGWMLEDDLQFDRLFAKLAGAGVPYEELSRTECAERGFGRAARMADPNFNAIMEFYIGENNEPCEFKPTLAKIQRLGHVVFSTPKWSESVAFYRDVITMGLDSATSPTRSTITPISW